MLSLVAIVAGAGIATNFVSGYLKSRDPIYQCISDPSQQPYQASIRLEVTEDGAQSLVPAGIGMSKDCTRPVHTLQQGVIHVAYPTPYNFTLGHFLYIWGIDLSKFNTKVYLNGSLYNHGSFLNLVLKDGQSIKIEFTRR